MTTTSLQETYSITLDDTALTNCNITSASWLNTNNYVTVGAVNHNSVMTVNSSGDDASLDIKGKVIINGENLDDRLSRIEQVLGIPPVDVNLHGKYPKLKQKYDDYIHELAKYTTWDRIKNE